MKTDNSGKIVSRQALLRKIALWQRRGETTAFTNGVFDILHIGHIHSLNAAAKLADRLVVGLNSDRSARTLDKGPGRPFNNLQQRAVVIASLEMVDAVVSFDAPTPARLIAAIKPDVLVKGGDYAPDEVVGREWAGRVVIVPTLKGFSTTALARRIRAGSKR